jgi:hypothetical protein
MRRIFFGISIAALACSASLAKPVEHPAAYDEFIAKHAKKHGVPERLVHRILMRESRYDPRVFHNSCYGLMQIKYPTARSMGYNGAPQGLFDPYVNMTYAIPYLANAYHIAGGDEDRAVQLFAAGYYTAAKQKRMIAALRTADSPPFRPEPQEAAAPEAPRPALPPLFAFLQSPAQTAPRADAAPTALAYADQAAATPAPPPQGETARPARDPDATGSIAAPKSPASKSAHARKARIVVALVDQPADKSAKTPVSSANAPVSSAKTQVSSARAKDAKAHAKAMASVGAPRYAAIGPALQAPAAASETPPVQTAPGAANQSR